MKLVMLTSSYDRSLKEEGFIADWIDALAKEVDELVVVLLNKPKDVPKQKNIHIYYLDQKTKIRKLIQLWNILNIEHKTNHINGVFSHIFEFLAAVAGLWGKLNRVKTAYWYAGGVNLNQISLNTLAFHLSDKVLTCSDSEAKRYSTISKIKNDKIIVMGHAINIDYFKPSTTKNVNNIYTIGYACRCTPQKNIESLIQACSLIDQPIKLKLALSRTHENNKYFHKLNQEIEAVKQNHPQLVIEILTNITYNVLPNYYHSLDLYVHPSYMKSIDKAGLEAMACNVPILLSKDGYSKIFDDNILIDPHNIEGISKKIKYSIDNKIINDDGIRNSIQNYSLKSFMQEIVHNWE